MRGVMGGLAGAVVGFAVSSAIYLRVNPMLESAGGPLGEMQGLLWNTVPLLTVIGALGGGWLVTRRKGGRWDQPGIPNSGGGRMRRVSAVTKWAGFALPAALTLLTVYALVAPGEGVVRTGWQTATTALLWLTPVVVLIGISLRWPPLAARVLMIGVALLVVTGIWYVIDPAAWKSWEGPDAIRGAFAVVLMAPTAVLGLRRAGLASRILLIVGSVLPVTMGLAGTTAAEFFNRPEASVSIVSLVAGVLYGLSELTNRAMAAPSARRPAAPRSRPA